MNDSTLSSPSGIALVPDNQYHSQYDHETADDNEKAGQPTFSKDVARLQDLLTCVDLGSKEKFNDCNIVKKVTGTLTPTDSITATSAAVNVNKPVKSRTRRGGTRRHRATTQTANEYVEETISNENNKNNNINSNSDVSPMVIPRSGWQRRGSMASCSSMSSVEEPPKRKIIRLRPHRSQDLYDAQRQDTELRTLMKERANGLSVRKVHGKSLVFYDDTRVYIPQSLRATTIKYYTKNYKYSHKQRLQESCYWPHMERDHRREFQWKILITQPDTKESTLVYDSDDYEFPTH